MLDVFENRKGRLHMTSAQLIAISVDIGQRLLESGAEIYRVEESISRICRAYGAQEANVYAVPTVIIASMVRGKEKPVTRVSRIYERGTNLGRLDQLNALCREICSAEELLSYDEIRERMHLIEQHSSYCSIELGLTNGLVGSLYTLLFGGGAAEAVCAFLTCVVLWLLTTGMGRIHVNTLFFNAVGGFWIASAGLAFYYGQLIEQYDTMIIGSIMLLVPGLQITNAIRDLIAGDFMAGMSRCTEALLVGAGIAVGAALPLSFVGLLGGTMG